MKKVLLVGGGGYVGIPMAAHLLDIGYEVVCLDLFVYGNNLCVLPLLSNKRFSLVRGDFRDDMVIRRALAGVTDVVVLAGLVGDPITKKYPQLASSVNDVGVQKCIETFSQHELEKVVFISTCSNYGLMELDEIANEESELKPLSLYAKSKVAAEKTLLSNKGAVDYHPVILRFATAFGLAPRMRFDLTVNEFTRDLACGQNLLVFDPHTWRPYCHVNDFARLVGVVLEAESDLVSFEVFNAGGDSNNYTKKMIVDTIGSYLPGGRITYQDQGDDPRSYKVDFRKVKNILGFEPLHSVSEGIHELIVAIEEGVFDNFELMKNFHGNYHLPSTLK